MYGANNRLQQVLVKMVLLSPMYGANIVKIARATFYRLLSPMYGANLGFSP